MNDISTSIDFLKIKLGLLERNLIMTIENNKYQMKRFTDFINTADSKLAEELIASDAIFYSPGKDDPMIGPMGYLAVIDMMRGGFPDIQWTLEETVAEEEMVAARFTMRGTHSGDFYGFPATNKKIQVQAMNFYKFSEGKIVKEYGQPDLLGLLQQIGAGLKG